MAMEEGTRPIVSHGLVRKRRKDGWTRLDEKMFLRDFRAPCNVRASGRDERIDGGRAPEHHIVWCDALAKWAYPDAA